MGKSPKKETPLSKWLEKKYLQWINEQGSVKPQYEFAKFLGIDRVTFNRYYNGIRERMDYQNAVRLATKLHDFEILDLLDYPRPEVGDLLAEFPPEFREVFSYALEEARSELVSKGITTSSPEAQQIINTAFERHGLKITWIEKESTGS